jgi:hypothetical protein
MLRGFILRRFVCGENSRGYGQMFARALSSDVGNSLAALETYLLDRGWPDDHAFESAFVEFPIADRAYAREILETLERARRHKEPADLRAAQVEHVMPQTLNDAWRESLGINTDRIHAEWLHRPGNLTLSAYNQELWNHPFSVKRDRYAQSNIVLTRELASYERWTESETRERGNALARQAAEIWIGPKEHVAQQASGAGSRKGFHLFDSLFSAVIGEVKRLLPIPMSTFKNTWAFRKSTQWIRYYWASKDVHVGLSASPGAAGKDAAMYVYFWNHGLDTRIVELIRANAESLRERLLLRSEDVLRPAKREAISKRVTEGVAAASVANFILALKPLLGDLL